MFCVDKKTAIQALDRKDPVLLLSAAGPGRPAHPEHRGGADSTGHGGARKRNAGKTDTTPTAAWHDGGIQYHEAVNADSS